MLQKDDDALSYTTNTLTKNVEWSIENELILVEWCDVAQCYKWLNSRAHHKVSFMHAWFTIPTITLSTITGTASFAQSSLSPEYQVYAPMIIGTINILVGILNTIQQYLKISELKESHRIAAIAWDKFSRNIRIELSKAPHERMDAGHFLKLTRHEYDRLMESSPSIPTEITREFTYIFSDKPGTAKQKAFEELKKPDICDSLVSSNQYRHHWYMNASANVTETNGVYDNEDEHIHNENKASDKSVASYAGSHTYHPVQVPASPKPYIPPSYPQTTIGRIASTVNGGVVGVVGVIQQAKTTASNVVSTMSSSMSGSDIEKGNKPEKGDLAVVSYTKPSCLSPIYNTDEQPNCKNSLTTISASLSAKNLIQNGYMQPMIQSPSTSDRVSECAPILHTRDTNPFDAILDSVAEGKREISVGEARLDVYDLSDNVLVDDCMGNMSELAAESFDTRALTTDENKKKK